MGQSNLSTDWLNGVKYRTIIELPKATLWSSSVVYLRSYVYIIPFAMHYWFVVPIYDLVLLTIMVVVMKRMMITIHSMKVCLLHDPWTHQSTSLHQSIPAAQWSHLALQSSIMAPATAWWRCRKFQTWTCPRVRCTTTILPVLSLSRYIVAIVSVHVSVSVHMWVPLCMHTYLYYAFDYLLHTYRTWLMECINQDMKISYPVMGSLYSSSKTYLH